MSLKEQVRQKFEEAKRAGQREDKNLLSVVLGDIATAEARSGKAIADADVAKLLRKMVESNAETVSQLQAHGRADDPQVAILDRETALLRALLPQTLDVAAIIQALEQVHADIVNAKNEGQATGVAMKHLKSLGVSVQGQDVAAAVKQIRTVK